MCLLHKLSDKIEYDKMLCVVQSLCQSGGSLVMFVVTIFNYSYCLLEGEKFSLEKAEEGLYSVCRCGGQSESGYYCYYSTVVISVLPHGVICPLEELVSFK